MNLIRLADPFPLTDIGWLATATNLKAVQRKDTKAKFPTKVLFVPYVDNRAIMERLDSVVGIESWKNEFAISPDGKGTICGISINIHGEWVTKWDGAEASQVEPVKGALSNSMKRAAVQWGVGRYLYGFDPKWVEVEQKYGNPPVSPLNLPQHMLPANDSLITPTGVDLLQFADVLSQARDFNIPEGLPMAGETLAKVAVEGGSVAVMLIRYFAGEYKSKDGYFIPGNDVDEGIKAVSVELLNYI